MKKTIRKTFCCPHPCSSYCTVENYVEYSGCYFIYSCTYVQVKHYGLFENAEEALLMVFS